MRVLYLDESGVGNLSKDPHLVVAGVLVHPDTQWHAIADSLRALLDGATPAGQPIPSYIHAKDVFHGTGEFPREHWPEAMRFELLDNVARLPGRFRLPVMWGLCDRVWMATHDPDETPLKQLINAYSVACMMCFIQAEWYMRHIVGISEVASITLEKNNELQKRIGEIYHHAKSQAVLEGVEQNLATLELLPLTRIIDEPCFQVKTGSSLLQLADFCCFAYKRAARKQSHYERFAKPLSQVTLLYNTGSPQPIFAPPSIRFGRT